MAKAKVKPKAEEDEVAGDADGLDAALAAVAKTYGTVVSTGKNLLDSPRMVIPFSPAVDSVIGGGIAGGSWVTMSGSEGLGKTVSSLSFAATCQRPEYGRRPVFFYAAEGRLKKRDLKGIRGLDLSDSLFHVVKSEKGKILSSKDFLTIATDFLSGVPGSVHIIDSVSALVNPTVLSGGLGTEDRGAGYKIVGQFCDLNQATVPINDNIVVGIVHLIANTGGGPGSGKVEKVPNRWKYQTDVWLAGKWAERWLVGASEDSQQIGQKVHWQVKKTAENVGPGGKCVSYLRYGTGIDTTYELLVFAKDFGLVTGTGWYTFSFLDSHHELSQGKKVQFQGMEKAYRALEENPAWAEALRADLNLMFTGGSDEG